MRRQMLIINLVLLVAAVGMGAKLRADWKRANQRYAVLAESAKPASPASAALPAGAAPAADLPGIAAHNLFAPDRTNELPKTAVERKPPPPEPIVIGTLNLGSGKIALLTEAAAPAGSTPRQVKEGEFFGGYKLVSIGDNQVTLEYEGQQKKVDVYTSARQVAAPPAVAAVAAPAAPRVVTMGSPVQQPAPQPANVTGTGSSPTAVGPTGVIIPGTTSMYGHKDNLPAGAVIGDRRKVVRTTPFGNEEWWELIKPEERKP